MVAAVTLDALAFPLDRSLLHVFVAGPGYGEGIAVALPEQGWLLLDGCQISKPTAPLRPQERLPLLAILDRWRDPAEPVDAYLLTHPHRDHAYGVRETLEATKPRFVGLTTSVSDPARVFLEVEATFSATTQLETLRRRTVLDAMHAIKQRFDRVPADLLPLVDGQQVPLTTSKVQAFVRGPDATRVDDLLASGGSADANEMSAIVEIVFGHTRIVLGSDLPTTSPGGTPLRAGWNLVMSKHSHLGDHRALKVPHHGSPGAFHPDLMSMGTERVWWVSPFNQGTRLPPTDPEGLPRLVLRNGRVSMTGTPHPRSAQLVHPDPATVRLVDLASLFAPARPMLPGAISVTPPIDIAPLDPLWCAAFDDGGNVLGTWRGNRAYNVVP